MRMIKEVIDRFYVKNISNGNKNLKEKNEFFRVMESARALFLGIGVSIPCHNYRKNISKNVKIDHKAEIFSLRSGEDHLALCRVGYEALRVLDEFKLPFPVCAFSFPAGIACQETKKITKCNMINILCDVGDNEYVSFFLSDSFLRQGVPVVPFYVGSFTISKEEKGLCFESEYCWSCMEDGDDAQKESLQNSFFESTMRSIGLVCAINIPGVSKSEKYEWSKKIQKKREDSGKSRLLDYNQIYMDIPKEQLYNHFSEGKNNPQEGVRFHSVIGHIRRIERPSGPKIVWVKPHYRGNAALGTVSSIRVLRPGKRE